MKTNLTAGLIRPVIFFFTLLLTLNVFSQSITVSNETFPNTFNTSFGTINNSNGTFTGSIGTWTGSSNTNAAVAVIPAYYSPVTNAIKIVNWNTTGKTFGECAATSPIVNLSSYNCASAMNLQFKLYTYTCNSNDANTRLHLEYSTNGTTWTSVYSKSSAEIFNTWGANAITTITVPIDQSYKVSTFKYRFRGNKPAGQGNDFYVFIDDVKILADACSTPCTIGGVNLGALTNYLFVFTNGSTDANWQGATKGFIGNVAVDGIQASERTSGTVPYAGTIYSNDASLNAWGGIVTANAGQAFSSTGQTGLLSGLETELNNVFTQINALSVSSGYNGIASTALNGLNTQNSIAETFVINVNSGFGVSSLINITGDANDVFILRWDTDMNFSNGYQGQVKFQSGGAIVPLGGLKPSNFIHVAGDINASGGGSNPATPYPQGPRTNNGTGTLISGGSDFSGGGFFTGYWFTKGDPSTGETAPLSNGIFVGGWYSTTTKFSMTSGTSGVYVAPVCGIGGPVCNANVTSLYFNKLDGGTDIPITNGSSFPVSLLSGSLYNLEAGSTGTVGSVKFTITGPSASTNIENTIPYNAPGGNSPWVPNAGSYSVNIKVYSGPDATGTLCDEETYTFILTSNNNCNCPGTNIVLNPSFESGTTNWTWSGGTLTQGTGAVACGSFSGDLNNTSATSKAWQNIGTDLFAGTVVNVSVYAGTHDNTFNNFVAVEFLDAANVVLGTSVYFQVDKILANAPAGPQLYTFSATVPYGAKYTRVAFGGNGSYTKTDQWCASLVVPTGSIGDRVWLDANGNGIQDATETGGITGVTVQLRNSAGTVIATTTTNGSGNYLFSNLPAGNYTVAFPVSISGAVVTTPNVGTNDDIDSDPSQSTGITPTITLASGQNIINVDAGYCPTTLQLGNRVFNDINNNGIDNTEAGISGATVNLYKDDNNDNVADGASIATVTTNATGNYTFTGLAPGNYIVGVVTPAGYASSAINGGDPDNNTDLDDNGQVTAGTEIRGLAITLTGGGEPNGDINNTYDFGFYLPIGSIGDRVWKDTDGDGIQDAGEVGVAGVTVVLLNAAGQVVATTTTDAFGNYKFSGLPAGNYSLRVTPPANYTLSAKTQGGDTNSDSDFDPITYTTSTVTLAAGQNRTDIDAGLKFIQPQPASVGDRVWLDTNGDGVQDAGEPGVSNVLVTLYNSVGTPVRSTYTDVNGNYLFTDLTPGSYTVGVSLPPAFVFSPNNGATSVADNSDINPANGRTATFTVNAGDQITYVDAGIKKQVSTNGSVGDFVWNDLDKDGVQDAGEPGISGVTVRLVNVTTNTVIATTTTDATGKYIFNDVPAGNYQVEFVTPAGYTTTTKLNSNVAASGTDSDVDPATSRTATFTLAAGQRITTVDAGYWLTTPPGTGKLGDRVWLDANQNGIQDAGEANVQGITVTLYDASNTAIKTAVTDANGNYLFTDLAGGNYTVGFSNVPAGFTFTTQGLGTAATGSDANPATGRTATIALGAGQTNLDVDAGIRSVMAGTASIGNRVWNDLDNDGIQDAGEPGIQGVTVELLDAAGNPIDSDPVTPGVQPTTTVTNALGEYLFTGLPAGDYRVRFSNLPAGYNASPKGAGADRNVDSDGNPIAAGTSTTDVISVATGEERLDIDFGLNNPTAPTGQLGDYVWFDSNNNGVQDATEQGVPGVTVSLLNASNTVIATTVTDANGNYRFVNLADATYSVRFSNLPAGFVFAPKDQGGNDNTDSDADVVTGQTGTYTIAGGNSIMTVDGGIYSTRAALGDYVWFDADSDGTQDATEKGIAGITVTLYDAANVAVTSAITDQNGRYFFSNLNPGTYTVGFGTIPSKLVFTAKDVVAAGDAADSDVDPATSRTGSYTLAAGQVNLTVDAGLKPFVPATIGDFVWYDLDRDGIQDAGEPGVPGITVTLYNSANQPIGSAVTDGNGYYLISNVPPGTGYYVVFNNKPDATAPWTLQNVGGAGANDNSKANASGQSAPFNVAEGQNITNMDAGLIKLINLSGNVWHDVNGLTDFEVNNSGGGSAAPLPIPLFVYLVNASTNLIEKVTLVSPSGTFNFTNITPGTLYYVYLSSDGVNVGNPPPAPTLPTGWIHSGQNLGAGIGNDFIPQDGRLTIPPTSVDVINANFGIQLGGDDFVIG